MAKLCKCGSRLYEDYNRWYCINGHSQWKQFKIRRPTKADIEPVNLEHLHDPRPESYGAREIDRIAKEIEAGVLANLETMKALRQKGLGIGSIKKELGLKGGKTALLKNFRRFGGIV